MKSQVIIEPTERQMKLQVIFSLHHMYELFKYVIPLTKKVLVQSLIAETGVLISFWNRKYKQHNTMQWR